MTKLDGDLIRALKQLEFLGPDNHLEDLFNDHHDVLILDPLEEVFDLVLTTLLRRNLVVLHHKIGVEDLCVLVSEQVQKQVAGDPKVELRRKSLVLREPLQQPIVSVDQLELKSTIDVGFTGLFEQAFCLFAE